MYDLETHQKKLGPVDHRLKTMVKRSIEQEIRNKKFGNRIGNFEKNAAVKNQGTKQCVQRILGDCWQWETNGQCVKGDNSSFRYEMSKRGKVRPNPSPNFMQQNEREMRREPEVPKVRVPLVECLDGLTRITSKELEIFPFLKNGTLQKGFSTSPRVVVELGKSARSHIVRLMNSLRKGLKRMMTKVLWPC